MKSTKLILAAGIAVASLAGMARADLLLSGTTAGFFQPTANPNTVITNSGDGSFASFRTGVPVDGSFKSGVVFTGHDFTNVGSGDTFSLGMLTYYNGITKIGTSSASALLDFSLNLTDPSTGLVNLTTITFGVDATINTPPNLVPDVFTASFTQPADVMIGDQRVRFHINGLPTSTDLAENHSIDLGSVTVTYLSPVPEPAVYGLTGAAGLLALAAYRRRAKSRSLRPIAA